jgi:hypothetical protein
MESQIEPENRFNAHHRAWKVITRLTGFENRLIAVQQADAGRGGIQKRLTIGNDGCGEG